LNQGRRAALVFVALALLAAAFRFPQLAARPMHADEAVHADKLGTLLETGRYQYSTVDYHGPSLYYVSLVAARAQGIKRYVDLNEITLRSVPAALGVLLVAAHFFLIPYIGLPAAASAGLFTAVSPAMVFYSRYYIHETLFVLLTFCALLALFAYWRHPTAARALLVGALAGLMFATKETVIIVAACVLVAHVLLGATPAPLRHVSLAMATALIVALVLMTSFVTHPRGIVDSVVAYGTYFHRGAGHDTVHVHPWYFYFSLLFYSRFSEAFLGVLALIGLFVAGPGIPRFLAVYTVLMAAAYSAIAYKAPWNILGFLHGMILVAGIATAWLLQRVHKVAILTLVLLGATQLGWEAHAASFTYSSDPRNPWVYAHTGTDVFAITQQLAAYTRTNPAVPIQIFTRENLWPLPWYLRRYPGVRWWNGVSDTAPNAPLILATPDMEPALLRKLYDLPPPGQREMYVNMFDRTIELRPRVEVRGYIAKSLWDEVQEQR
jgi:uncharacterized protein (TIGR03663 family)